MCSPRLRAGRAPPLRETCNKAKVSLITAFRVSDPKINCTIVSGPSPAPRRPLCGLGDWAAAAAGTIINVRLLSPRTGWALHFFWQQKNRAAYRGQRPLAGYAEVARGRPQVKRSKEQPPPAGFALSGVRPARPPQGKTRRFRGIFVLSPKYLLSAGASGTLR